MGEYILTKSLLLFLHIEYFLSLQNLDFPLWLKLSVLRTGIILFRYSIGKDNCAIKGCPNTAGQIRRLGKAVKPHPLWKARWYVLLGFAPLAMQTVNFQNVLNCATIIFWVELVEIGNILFQLFICDRIRIYTMCQEKLGKVNVQQIMTFSTELTTVKMLATVRS